MKKGGDEERNGADEQTGKMNADEDWKWWDKRKTGGKGRKYKDGRLKYLWWHLCWCMTPPLCNNMNGDSVGCLESPNFTCSIYRCMWFCLSRCVCFIKSSVSVWRQSETETGKGRKLTLFTEQQRKDFTSCHEWVWWFVLKLSYKTRVMKLWLGFSWQLLRFSVVQCSAFHHQ